MLADWASQAKPHQIPPRGDWTTWLILGGRGAGKTRAGAEWVRAVAAADRSARIALVGETHGDVRAVMVEGVSGLLAVHPARGRPRWQSSRRRLEWPNGAIAEGFSSEDPEGLRGPQFSHAWCDEVAKWRYPEATFDMLQFALRLGERPRQVATTTPRPVALVKRLLADPSTAVTRAPTAANAENLAAAFLEAITARYRGSLLGRQELDGELIEDRADALWRRTDVERARVDTAPDLARVVVAVDPPASSGARSDACGIVAAGIDGDGLGYVLADATMPAARPSDWAARVAGLYSALHADAVVAEVNQGGDMVASVIAQADPSVRVKPVRATRGKFLRAEPVAALYAAGRVRHVGAFAELDDEMCDFAPTGLSNGRSPDRLDALVWALTDLMLATPRRPRVRGL